MQNNFMKNDIVIEILQFGRQNMLEHGTGLNSQEIKEHLEKKGFDMTIPKNNTNLSNVMNQYFSLFSQNPLKYSLKLDAYFYLLEYEELQDARASSKQANWWAIIALIISILGSGASIYYSRLQIDTPSEIKQSQLDTLVSKLITIHKDISNLK